MARKNTFQCSVTGEEIKEAYVYVGELEDPEDRRLFKTEKNLIAFLRSLGDAEYNSASDEYILKEAYQNGLYYFTEVKARLMEIVDKALDWIEENLTNEYVSIEAEVRIHDTEEEWTVSVISVNSKSVMYLDGAEVEEHPLTYVNGLDLIKIKNRIKNGKTTL
jgi:hypothetical protein